MRGAQRRSNLAFYRSAGCQPVVWAGGPPAMFLESKNLLHTNEQSCYSASPTACLQTRRLLFEIPYHYILG